MGVNKKFIQFSVPIDPLYTDDERLAISQDIIDFVVGRTERGVDKDGKAFPKYSKGYVKSLDFHNAHKSAGKVNLTLSGDMLAAMRLVGDSAKKITMGYNPGDAEAGRVEGNVTGSYGGNTNRKKARNFLGISKKDLEAILSKYPIDDEEARALRASEVLQTIQDAKEIADDVGLSLSDEDA